MPKDIQPESAVDRDDEQKDFRNLLAFQDEVRLLIIRDQTETGKSTLLKRLHYNCTWEESPKKEAGLVDLDSSKDKELITEFDLILRIRQSLSKVKFAGFDLLNNARISRNSAPFRGPGAISQNFQGASFSGGQVKASGMNIESQTVQNQTIIAGSEPWSAEQEEQAQNLSIEAFFSDLKAIADQQPIVILLDSFDKLSNQELQVWIRDSLISTLCFDLEQRPAKLMLVVAGRELPGLMPLINHPNYGKLIRSKTPLSSWSDEHVEAFLKLHGYQNLDEEEMKQLVSLAKSGRPIGLILRLADAFNQFA
jgi:hypothetical protein